MIQSKVLRLLVYKLLPGKPQANCKRVLWLAKAFWRQNKVTDYYNNLKISMFVPVAKWNKVYPKLKGRAVEVRSLGPALLSIWKDLNLTETCHLQVKLGLEFTAARLHAVPAFCEIRFALIAQTLKHHVRFQVRMDAILNEFAVEWKLPEAASQEYIDCAFKFTAIMTDMADTFWRFFMKP